MENRRTDEKPRLCPTNAVLSDGKGDTAGRDACVLTLTRGHFPMDFQRARERRGETERH